MDFVFQGFQSILPVWMVVLLLIAAVYLSWWSYREVKLPFYPKYGLITLRSLVFFLLLFLLANPLFKSRSTYLEKSTILVLLDNSASTSINKGQYRGEQSYREVLRQLHLSDTSEVKYDLYSFGGTVEPSATEDLSFNRSETDLFNTMETIQNNRSDITGAILVSDGIFTKGRTPAFEAGKVTVPIFTIALGDTIDQQDLIVKRVETAGSGYLDTRHNVEVLVSSNGYAGSRFDLNLYHGEKLIRSRRVRAGDDQKIQSLMFELDLEKEGLNQYRVEIPSLPSEWTAANNSQPFTVDVLDRKQRILSLAFEIYPDIRVLRHILESDKHTSLISRTWLGGNTFIEGPLSFDADTLDLVILHGFPDNDLKSKTEKLFGQTPLIYMATPRSALERMETIPLPVSKGGGRDNHPAKLIPAVESTAHPVMELPELDDRLLPAISVPAINDSRPGYTHLFEAELQNNEKTQPLITVTETANIRRSFVLGFGWYRYYQSPNDQHRKYIQRLLENLAGWTAARPDNRRLHIRPANKVFSGTEQVVFNATLTNESGLREAEATIELTIYGDEIERRFYSMENLGNGEYRLAVRSLPGGVYRFEAKAVKGNRTIDTQVGELSVNRTNIEFVDTRRNDRLLKQIAARSGGSSFIFNNLEGLADSLEKKEMLAKAEKETESLFYPYQHSFWFIVVILLLTLEWISRKYFALP